MTFSTVEEIPQSKRPFNETFTLPDLTPINVNETKGQKILVSIGQTPKDYRIPAPKEEQEKNLKPIVEFVPLQRKARVSLYGVVDDSRAEEQEVWELKTLDEKLSFEDIWCALYCFWIRRDGFDRYPIQVGSDFKNEEKVFKYLVFSGLGFQAPDAKHEYEVLLDRSTFWQGAGAPLDRSWLRSPQPHPSVVGDLLSTSFPFMLSFTRNQNVLTTHPVRPPKPPPGAIIYSRYIHSVGSHLQLFHIDPDNKEHSEKLSLWINDNRLSDDGWKREKGDLQSRMDDPHTISYISTWDGVYTGFGEINWSKEDAISAFVGGLNDYDQSSTTLIGDENFNGKLEFVHMSLSTKHFCFLRESRTKVVIGVPTQADPDIVGLLKTNLPQDLRRQVELPSKRAAFVSEKCKKIIFVFLFLLLQ